MGLSVRRHQHKLNLAFEQRVLEEINSRLDTLVLPHYNEKYQEYCAVVNARKGVMTAAEYRELCACLHPDQSMSEERRLKVFVWLSDTRMRLKLVAESESPTDTMTFKMPATAREWGDAKLRAAAQRREKRLAKQRANKQ